MAIITVTVEDDVRGELDFDVGFRMTARPSPATWYQPAEGAEFEVHIVWDAEGKLVTGTEADAVAAVALDCYYDEMLDEWETRDD